MSGEAGGLPMTGSGPFTFVLGLIGIAMALGGWIVKRIARRPEPA